MIKIHKNKKIVNLSNKNRLRLMIMTKKGASNPELTGKMIA